MTSSLPAEGDVGADGVGLVSGPPVALAPPLEGAVGAKLKLSRFESPDETGGGGGLDPEAEETDDEEFVLEGNSSQPTWKLNIHRRKTTFSAR